MRILSIDYGKKRTGIAVTDSLQIIANGLTTVDTSDLIKFLKEYTAKEAVERFVLGLRPNPTVSLLTICLVSRLLLKNWPRFSADSRRIL